MFPETMKGSFVIDSKEKRIKALKWILVEDVWGIGVKKANDFLYYPKVECWNIWLLKGLRLQNDLKRISFIQMEEVEKK